jgi:hypothetical protein
MAGNPFFSGRIPQDLHDRIQQHCLETGETKTQILINALAAYLNHPVKENLSNSPVTREEFAALQEQVIALEKLIQTSNQAVITTDNIDTTDAGLELICLERRCPSCHADEISAIPYEIDNEVRFDCLSCGWQKLYPLSAAKELGYIPYAPEPDYEEEEEEVDNRADNGGDNALSNALRDVPEFLNAANLARRLGISKSVISRRKSEATFEDWSKEHDPDAIAWRYDRQKQKFNPVTNNAN